MTPYEIMLSESQERMLIILKPGRENEARRIFEKWELDFAVIGRGHRDRQSGPQDARPDRRRDAGGTAGQPGAALRPAVGPDAQAPGHRRGGRQGACRHHGGAQGPSSPAPTSPPSAGSGSSTIHLVMGDTIQRPGGDARWCGCATAARRWRSPPIARRATASPIRSPGGAQAVAESWRNLTAVGALYRSPSPTT